jgi:butyrate kinase
LDVYTYRIAGAVASMSAALGGLDSVVFTAGVGEHSPAVRAAVCERLEFLGVKLDLALNGRSTPDADIAEPGSAVRVLHERGRTARAQRQSADAREPVGPETQHVNVMSAHREVRDEP